jgi:hypothetical protein
MCIYRMQTIKHFVWLRFLFSFFPPLLSKTITKCNSKHRYTQKKASFLQNGLVKFNEFSHLFLFLSFIRYLLFINSPCIELNSLFIKLFFFPLYIAHIFFITVLSYTVACGAAFCLLCVCAVFLKRIYNGNPAL